LEGQYRVSTFYEITTRNDCGVKTSFHGNVSKPVPECQTKRQLTGGGD